MKFCSEQQNKSEIIKEIKLNKNINYEIEYLDGTISKYINYDITHYEKLKNKMIEQAIERNNQIDIVKLTISKYLSLISSIISSYGISRLLASNLLLLEILFMFIDLVSIKNYRESKRQIKELKKYKFYLEMIKDGNIEIEDYCEPDSLYRNTININNIDHRSIHDLKFIKKYNYKLN